MLLGGWITDCPPMKGCRTSGMATLPSSRWKFSRIATTILGTAQAVAFNVCTNSVGTFFAFFLSAPPVPLLMGSSFTTGLQPRQYEHRIPRLQQ